MRAARTLALALSLTVAAACAPGPEPCSSASACGTGRECLANRCVPYGGEPVSPDARRVVLEPSQMAFVSANRHPNARELPGALVFGSEPEGSAALYLAFPRRAQGSLERAFLLLEPMPATAVDATDVGVRVWRITEPWSPETLTWHERPALAPPRSRGIARSSPPSTLRIDVTEIVRHLAEHPRAGHGLVVEAPATTEIGAAYASGSSVGRAPRLEIYEK